MRKVKKMKINILFIFLKGTLQRAFFYVMKLYSSKNLFNVLQQNFIYF